MRKNKQQEHITSITYAMRNDYPVQKSCQVMRVDKAYRAPFTQATSHSHNIDAHQILCIIGKVFSVLMILTGIGLLVFSFVEAHYMDLAKYDDVYVQYIIIDRDVLGLCLSFGLAFLLGGFRTLFDIF